MIEDYASSSSSKARLRLIRNMSGISEVCTDCDRKMDDWSPALQDFCWRLGVTVFGIGLDVCWSLALFTLCTGSCESVLRTLTTSRERKLCVVTKPFIVVSEENERSSLWCKRFCILNMWMTLFRNHVLKTTRSKIPDCSRFETHPFSREKISLTLFVSEYSDTDRSVSRS